MDGIGEAAPFTLITRPPVWPSAPLSVMPPVLLMLSVNWPEPVVGAETVRSALPVELRTSPAGLTVTEPPLMVSGLLLDACVMNWTFEPTPPVILFSPLPVPTGAPSTLALLKVNPPLWFTGLVLNST